MAEYEESLETKPGTEVAFVHALLKRTYTGVPHILNQLRVLSGEAPS